MVETYLLDELKDIATEDVANEEWKKLVEECNLAGQKEMLAGTKKETPIPFPRMKTHEHRVYQTLCPNYQSATSYSGGTIPLRVLSMIALCQKEKWFKELEIWHNEGSPDPILVGYIENRYNSGEPFLIARWGDELCSFVELTQRATNILKKRWTDKLKAASGSIDGDVDEYLSGKAWNLSLSV